MTLAAIRRKGLRITGALTTLELFGNEHLNDPDYLNWLHDPDVVRTLNLPEYLAKPVPFEEVKSYCDQLMGSQTDLFLAIRCSSDDAFVGTIKAGHIDWRSGVADIGIMIGAQAYWGRGIAQDSILGLSRYLFDDLGLRKLTCGAMAINKAMISVFEKLGFRHEACLRAQDCIVDDEFCDHVLLGCFKHELRSPS